MVVLDLTRLLPGALATQILCDFGATVYKIEQPGGGDPARYFPVQGHHLLFDSTNLGKKSVVIDLKRRAGKEALIKMAERADVLIESFRPGVMKRLGLSYESLKRHNPKLSYVSINGYGTTGHYIQMPGHDLNYCALSGLLRPQPMCKPTVPVVPMIDVLGGLYAVVGILFSRRSRQQSLGDRQANVSLLDAATSLLRLTRATSGDGLLSGSYGCYNVYKTKDAAWIAVGALEPKFWRLLCQRIRRHDLIELQFVPARQGQIIKILRKVFLTRSAREWFRLLRNACVTPVLTGTTLAGDAKVQGRLDHVEDTVSYELRHGIPILSPTPKAPSRSVPALGQHTREALRWAGFSASRIDFLASHRIVETGCTGA